LAKNSADERGRIAKMVLRMKNNLKFWKLGKKINELKQDLDISGKMQKRIT
jgi:hypothetical protein